MQGNSRPEVSMAVHQSSRFSNNPMLSHKRALKCIGQYLLQTKRDGIINNPDTEKVLECYVDAYFAGGWQQADSRDADNVMSRTGMVIMYANWPINWRSLLQIKFSLSTVEEDYIELSSTLREVLLLMVTREEINKVFPLLIQNPKFVCQFHEYNQSCIKMATGTKFSPRTKHIALKYHHFRSNVKSGWVEITYIPTDEKLADILTKPL